MLLVLRAGNLTAIMCRMSISLEASAFSYSQDPSNPNQGLLYFFLLLRMYLENFDPFIFNP